MSELGPTQFDDHERDHFLGFHRRLIGYDNGYWVTFRVTLVAPSLERPHGFQYSLSLHDANDDRVLGYAHGVGTGSGPAKKSSRHVAYDHINRRGRRPVPYKFTTPYRLLEDFFTEVDTILNKEGVS